MSARSRQDLGMKRGVSIGRGRPAYGTSRCRGIRTNSKFIARQLLQSTSGHHQHYNVGGLHSDLWAEAATAELNRRRTGPSGIVTAKRVALSIICTHSDCGLLQTRNNHHALRFLEQIARYARSSLGLAENVGCRTQPVIGSLLLSP